MPTLYGPDGRPVSLPQRDLARRTAAPSRTGWRRTQQWQSVVATLDPARLRSIYFAIANGTWCPEYWELAQELEERDLHYFGVLQQRRLRSAGAPIDVIAASDAAADQRLADDVRERVLQGPGWHRMLLELLDAVGKGVSCQEIVWRMRAGRWEPAAYHRVDQRWLVWDDADGETPLLIREQGAMSARRQPAAGRRTGAFRALADPLPPGKFIYHAHQARSGLPTRGGLAFSVATMYLLKSLSVRDWWAYAELFGIPVRLGKYGATATDEDIRTLTDAIAALAADAGAAIPDTMDIDVSEPRAGGGGAARSLFAAQAAWCDQQTSKAVVGQTMTADDGGSRAQAEVHLDVREDLVTDDVRQACETLSDTVVRWYCELNYGMRPAGWPRVALPQPPADLDMEALMKAVDRGLRVPAVWLRERLSVPEPQGDEEVLTGAGPPAADQDADPDADPAPQATGRQAALHAARSALDEAAAWGEIAEDLVASVRAALASADTADAFLEAAAAAGAPAALAENLAQQMFEARVTAEGRPESG